MRSEWQTSCDALDYARASWAPTGQGEISRRWPVCGVAVYQTAFEYRAIVESTVAK
jgi:hypothetical protein